MLRSPRHEVNIYCRVLHKQEVVICICLSLHVTKVLMALWSLWTRHIQDRDKGNNQNFCGETPWWLRWDSDIEKNCIDSLAPEFSSPLHCAKDRDLNLLLITLLVTAPRLHMGLYALHCHSGWESFDAKGLKYVPMQRGWEIVQDLVLDLLKLRTMLPEFYLNLRSSIFLTCHHQIQLLKHTGHHKCHLP